MVFLVHILQQLATALDECDQTTLGVDVVLVCLQVLGKMLDACGQQRDLDLGGSHVAFLRRVFFDDRFFVDGFGAGHVVLPHVFVLPGSPLGNAEPIPCKTVGAVVE